MDSRLLFLLILLPLAVGVINACVGCRLPRCLVALLAISSILGSFLVAISCWSLAAGPGTQVKLLPG